MPYFLFLFFIALDTQILNLSINYISKKYDNVKNKEIFQENFHSLFHYTFSSLILSVLFFNNTECLNNNGSYVLNRECTNGMELSNVYDIFLMFELSYYVISLAYLFFYKKIKRNDQKIMYLHHIIAIFLLRMSCDSELTKKISIYTAFTHNLCDIPLNIYMLIDNNENFNKNKSIKTKSIYTYIQSAMALLTLILFGYLRIFMFGSLNLHVFYYSYDTLFITRLCSIMIYGLNVFWFYLMIVGIFNKIFNSKNGLYD